MIPQLRNSRISTRLMAVITVLLILLAVVAGLSFRGFQSLASSANDLVDGQVRLALLANRTNQNAQIASQYLLRLLLTADRKARLPLYAAMDDALNSADQALLQFETLALQTKVDIDIVELQRLREHYGTAFQETVEQIELVGPQSAKAHFETTTEPELKALLAATDRLAVTLQDAMQAETKRLTELTATARQRIVAIGVIALLMGILLGSLIARSITIPVKQAAAIAAGIAGGDYTR